MKKSSGVVRILPRYGSDLDISAMDRSYQVIHRQPLSSWSERPRKTESGQRAEQIQRQLENFERNGLEGRRPEARQRGEQRPAKYIMKTDAFKPSHSSRKSDVITTGNLAPIYEDVKTPEVFNEEDAS